MEAARAASGLEVLQRSAVRALAVPLLLLVGASVVVLHLRILNDNTAEYLLDRYAVAPPHFAHTRTVVYHELYVLFAYDGAEFVEYLLLHYGVGTVFPAVAHQDVIKRAKVHFKPVARVVAAVVVATGHYADIVARIQPAHHLYDWLPRRIVEHHRLVISVTHAYVIRHGAVNVHEYPLGVGQTNVEPTRLEVLSTLKVRASQLVFLRCLFSRRHFAQVLALLSDDAFANHDALCLTALAADFTASLVALNANLHVRVELHDAELHTHLLCKLFPLLPGLAD